MTTNVDCPWIYFAGIISKISATGMSMLKYYNFSDEESPRHGKSKCDIMCKADTEMFPRIWGDAVRFAMWTYIHRNTDSNLPAYLL